jgi:adhesin HecA-like repeat protein
MRIRVAPSEAGFMALNALLEGLEKTGRRELWGFAGWPFLDIRPKAPETTLFPGQRSFSFAVQTALVNENGKVIARGNLTLKTGALAFKAGDRLVKAPEAALGQVVYPKVNAMDLTPTLTVVIAGVNKLSGRQISETGYMRIAPEDIGRELEEQRLAEQRRLEEQRLAEQRRQVENQRGLDRTSMVLVEGGTFQMGSNNGDSDEKPVHTVTVKSFYMGKYEVTQKEWAAVMGNNPSDFKGDNLPVEKISWNEAIEYCNQLSQKEGLTPAYRGSGDTITCDFNASGYRLPTEAEWEYAARGGNKGPAYEYSGGNSADSVAWYSGNSGSSTHPVGTKQPNSLGLYDMSGNVCEWCWDWYGSYTGEAQTNPAGASSGANRVYRGGSWGSVAAYVRSADRNNYTPFYRFNSLGFRLVRPQF